MSTEADAASLRARAEERLKRRSSDYEEAVSAGRPLRVFDELNIHQMELELQNEALIEARTSLEAALRRATELYDMAPTAYVTLTRNGTIAQANDAAATLFGLTQRSLSGRPLSEFVSAEDAAMLSQFVVRIFTSGDKQHWEAQIRRDGAVIDAHFEATRSRDHSDSFVIIVDLTERKLAETERALLRDRLVQSQKLESIGRLAGGVAHDFNNLLAVILSYVDILCNQVAVDSAMQVDLAEVRRAARRAAELTQKLLAYAGRQLSRPKPVSLNELVESMLEMLRRVLGADIDVVFVRADPLGSVTVDAGQIEQAIMSLAMNARDGMPNGGKLLIETSPVASAGGNPVRVLLRFSDTGLGMDAETASHIFEPFFTTKRFGEVGLGLASVLGIVEQNGGTIEVESTIGRGTAFNLHFPQTATVPPPAVLRRDAVSSHKGTEAILLVEDEDQVRRVASRILTRAGYRVIEAANGREALAICATPETEIDLVLSDVVMPVMGGPELAERLSGFRPRLNVVFMSGYSESEPLSHFGVFLPKPFSPTQLLEVVREALDR
ncbi:hypothetical protein BH09MYX1_BH09MYX1_07140 [soil metagenome]